MIHAFTDHGIDHVVIVNGHTTNAPLIAEVTHAIRRETGLVVPNLNLWRLLPERVWRDVHGDAAAAARGHGADPLTSLMLHLTPELVRTDLIAPAARTDAFGLPTQPQFAGVDFRGMPVDMPLDVTDVAANGIGGGNPALASGAAGERIAEETVVRVAAFLDHWRAQDPRSHGSPA